MKKFIVYDDDGNILSQFQCLESEIADNVPSGYSYQEFDGDPLNKKLVDGKLIEVMHIDEAKRNLEVASIISELSAS